MKKPRVEDFAPNTPVPSLGSPLDGFPAIKPPGKEANLVPVVPLEQAQNQRPTTPPLLRENTLQMTQEVNKKEIERTFVRSNERSNERTKIRHTFDIFKDQLLSLRKIATEREETFGKRVRLGDLVQEV